MGACFAKDCEIKQPARRAPHLRVERAQRGERLLQAADRLPPLRPLAAALGTCARGSSCSEKNVAEKHEGWACCSSPDSSEQQPDSSAHMRHAAQKPAAAAAAAPLRSPPVRCACCVRWHSRMVASVAQVLRRTLTGKASRKKAIVRGW